MDTQAHMSPNLGALAITMEERARRRHAQAQAQRQHDPSSSSMAWLMPEKNRTAYTTTNNSTSNHISQLPQATSSSSTTTPNPIPGAYPDETLADTLCRLSRACVDMFNSRQYERHWVTAYYTEDFTACMAGQSEWLPLGACAAHFRGLVARRPALHFAVTEGTASVDERLGAARVFQSVDVTGQTPGIVGHEMVVLEWRRQTDGGGWKCAGLMGFRGVLGSVA